MAYSSCLYLVLPGLIYRQATMHARHRCSEVISDEQQADLHCFHTLCSATLDYPSGDVKRMLGSGLAMYLEPL